MCADKNVLSIAFDDSTTTNYESQSLFVQKLAPKNINLTPATGAISGDVIWEFSTPKDTFLDLSKTYMSAEIKEDEKKDDTIYPNDRLLLPCMFQRAVCYVNGVRISTSNNYTQDGFLSRRLQFGDSYNKSVNSMFSFPTFTDAYVVPADASTLLIAKDTLDSFWLRQSEGLIVPPNCNIRFEFTVDAKWREKNYFTGSGAVAKVGTGPKVQAMWMNPCFYVNPSEVKPSYRLRFISINSFMSQLAANATAQTLQYTVSPTIVKCCYTMQGADYQTEGTSKRCAAFTFVNRAAIQSLQFKHGNLVYPQTTYNFAYGLEQAYEDYVNHTQQIAKDSGKEIYDMYANKYNGTTAVNNWGPVFCAPIVKDRSDPTNTIELNATFTGVAAVTYTILSSLEEQSIDISMDGFQITTRPTV
jgi:hypothetical protein